MNLFQNLLRFLVTVGERLSSKEETSMESVMTSQAEVIREFASYVEATAELVDTVSMNNRMLMLNAEKRRKAKNRRLAARNILANR